MLYVSQYCTGTSTSVERFSVLSPGKRNAAAPGAQPCHVKSASAYSAQNFCIWQHCGIPVTPIVSHCPKESCARRPYSAYDERPPSRPSGLPFIRRTALGPPIPRVHAACGACHTFAPTPPIPTSPTPPRPLPLVQGACHPTLSAFSPFPSPPNPHPSLKPHSPPARPTELSC